MGLDGAQGLRISLGGQGVVIGDEVIVLAGLLLQGDVLTHREYHGMSWSQVVEIMGLSSRGQAERLYAKAKAAWIAALLPGDGDG